MDLRLAGRVALVCGSSQGLGRAIAVALGREGCRVALNGRDPDRLAAALGQVQEFATRGAEGFPADVSDPEQVEQLVHGVRERFGSVDVLVANAGGPPATQFETTPADAWQDAIDLNLLSTIQLCRHTVPLMRKRRWGRIICLASVAAKQPMPGLILSTTARAGVLGFAKALATELAPDGITVNAVCPGYMRTGRVSEILERRAEDEERDPGAIADELVADIPMGRMGEPEELAAAVTFLASESAGYITGVALQVDGGFVRSIL